MRPSEVWDRRREGGAPSRGECDLAKKQMNEGFLVLLLAINGGVFTLHGRRVPCVANLHNRLSAHSKVMTISSVSLLNFSGLAKT